MKTMNWLLAGAMAVSLGAVAQMPAQQTGSEAKMVDGQNASSGQAAQVAMVGQEAAGADVTDDALVKMTVHEAWVASGRNEDKFFDMVKRVAEMSATKRGVALPDNQEAGSRFGNMVKTSARKDPDQLLYAVVDNAVKMSAAKMPMK